MGYFIAFVIVLIILATPFVIVSLAPIFLIARRLRRTATFAITAGFLTLAIFWALTFMFFAVSDLIEDERLTPEGDPPWWAWLAFYDGLFSSPVFAIGALVGWHAAKPKDLAGHRASN
jgi:hypothetical protein